MFIGFHHNQPKTPYTPKKRLIRFGETVPDGAKNGPKKDDSEVRDLFKQLTRSIKLKPAEDALYFWPPKPPEHLWRESVTNQQKQKTAFMLETLLVNEINAHIIEVGLPLYKRLQQELQVVLQENPCLLQDNPPPTISYDTMLEHLFIDHERLVELTDTPLVEADIKELIQNLVQLYIPQIQQQEALFAITSAVGDILAETLTTDTPEAERTAFIEELSHAARHHREQIMRLAHHEIDFRALNRDQYLSPKERWDIFQQITRQVLQNQ